MAQIDRSQRRESPRTPTTPDGEFSRLSSMPIPPRQHDMEEDHGHHSPKKSVLTKVKEKAKKLKHSLSLNKKKHNDDSNATPSWGVSLDDEEEEEEQDAEYLGAPMYESELAPDSYKESARQHPRANLVISEKPILPLKTENMTVETTPISSSSKPIQTKPNETDHSSPKKTVLTEPLTPKTLTPIPETASEDQELTYNSALSKIQDLNIANSSPKKEASKTNSSHSNNSSPLASQSSSILSSPKKLAVSVKDYLLNKFEPAEEDRALSRAISEAMTSPSSAKRNSSSENNNNKNNNGEPSVADKVREAVASLLRNHQQNQNQNQNQQLLSPPAPKTPVLTRSDTTPLMPRHIPISTNPREVQEEENLGRILQAN